MSLIEARRCVQRRSAFLKLSQLSGSFSHAAHLSHPASRGRLLSTVLSVIAASKVKSQARA